jgi:uncharacterized membrane protein YheB (UPF0754 family)
MLLHRKAKRGIQIEENKLFWEQLRTAENALLTEKDIHAKRRKLQKNAVMSAIKIILQQFENYEVASKIRKTKQNAQRGPVMEELTAALKKVAEAKNVTLNEIIQILRNAQDDFISQKQYGWLGYAHSDYYQALEKSIIAIQKTREVVELIVGKFVFESENTPTFSLLGQHRGPVRSLAVLKDGQLASGSEDKNY